MLQIDGGQLDRRQFAKASLSRQRKPAYGFNLIAEKLESDRVISVRRKHIQYAAASAKVARNFDCLDALKAVTHQPCRHFIGRFLVTRLEESLIFFQLLPGWR